jgi:hypothetical protein
MKVGVIITILTLMATTAIAYGDIKLYGDLVFPDGTKQSMATVQGPVGLQGAQGDIGLKGDKGDTGAQGMKGDTGASAVTGVGIFIN